MTGDALLALGGIEAVGTVTGLSTGGCGLSSTARDTWVTGATKCVNSSDRSVTILSAYGGVRAVIRRADGLRRRHP